MLDGETTDGGEVTETTAAPLEDVTSSTETTETADQGTTTDQGTTQSDSDPLKVLESLELDPAVKETLKAGYLRQQDYTKKTQELAKDRGTLDEYRKVQPVIEFLGKNPELFNEIVGKMTPQPQGQEEVPTDPKEYAAWVKAETIKEFQAIQATEADYQSAAKVDPRLDSDPEFGETIARIVASDPEFKSGNMSATEATRKAVANFDKYISKAIGTAKQNLSLKARQKRSGSTVASQPGKVGGGTQPMTIEEAARQAEEELASN